MELKKLLKPRSLAVVGVSERDTLGGLTAKMLVSYSGDRMADVYFINPKYESLLGYKCYPSLSSLPEEIDLVIIATPKETVEGLLKEAHGKGARGAVVYASGYGETGKPEDREDEKRLIQLCRELDMALMGPNCAGYLNFVDRVFSFGFMVDASGEQGKVGLAAQSGQICMSMLDSPKTSFSYMISSGNSKVVSVEEYLNFLVDDDDTKVVAAYLEGVGNPRLFIDVLIKASKKRKPVVILKAGGSEKGARVASSHTGSMAGSSAAFDALFRKYGAIRVNDMEELIGVSSALAAMPSLPRKNAVSAVNASGGETAISADAGSLYGMEFPDFEPETIEKLKKILPDYATPQNPLDTTAMICYDADVYKSALEAVAADKNIELIIIGYTIVEDEKTADPSMYTMTEGIEKFMASGNKKPVLMMPYVESGRVSAIVKRLNQAGVPVLPPPMYAYSCIRHIMTYAAWLKTRESRTFDTALPMRHDGKRRALSELESKKFLMEYGINCGTGYLAKNRGEALKYAEKTGYPLVMKIESADILHKSDAGAVRLNIETPEQVCTSFDEIMDNARAYKPNAEINGVLIQKMLRQGTEIIIGVTVDEQFGPMVLVGFGGIYVELFKDVALYPAPLNKAEALEMIHTLKASKLFYGFRNAPELDADALAETLVSVGRFAADNKDRLLELDINPLFVYEKGEGVAAADALLVFRDRV